MKLTGAGIKIISSGSATPTTIVTNDELSRIVDTSDEWISTRTGIRQRRIASAEESLAHLAALAGEKALEMAGLAATDIDMIILATSTADDLFGSAAQVQGKIGASRAIAFDLTAACSGFIFGLITAAQYINTGMYQNILLIGADILSRWVDWSDRSTCVLFGDGAGAVVCQATTDSSGLLGFEMCSNGGQNHCLNVAYAGKSEILLAEKNVSKGTYQPITMNGREVYRFAVAKVPEVIEKAMYRANISIEDIDWLLLHQANQRIIDAVAKRLSIPPAKVISNLANYGNTSAASIPLALDEAVRVGKLQAGDIIAASGFGAGLSWGGAIFRWQ
ncbi:MAG: beta-ketoacyl-ACP synthase III [Cyanobacteria bacterium J083]|nr:MAG: beta-ketoacyl-ACP synthase III [Cyanobacteria bacterium J083]